jgi:hypothetical protein
VILPRVLSSRIVTGADRAGTPFPSRSPLFGIDAGALYKQTSDNAATEAAKAA